MVADQKFEIIRRRAFSAIPDDIFLDKRISLSARTVLAYAIGRPPGWNLHVSNWKTTLGIGDAAWRRISTELKDAGYLYQEQHHHPSGKIFWLNFVTDSPELSPTIPSNTTRGKTTCGETTRGKPTNIAIGLEQAVLIGLSHPPTRCSGS